jgi:nitrile hydratase accessory protein
LNPSDAFAPDAGKRTFREPWEAQAFALAVALHEKGLFSWSEWAAALAREIAAAGPRGSGEDYYLHWLCALEKIVVAKGAASAQSLTETRDAWDRAARATPHGMPIELGMQ